MKNLKTKLPRELRLAYLCSQLHRRMLKGDSKTTTWQRHYKLVVEWERCREVRAYAA